MPSELIKNRATLVWGSVFGFYNNRVAKQGMSNENSFWVCFVALGNYVNYWNCSSGPAPMLGCERVLLPYRLSFHFDTCDMHVTCRLVPLLGCRLYQRRLMPPCSSCLGQIKCYQAQISSASLAMLQLKHEACLLVGKLLEMKALTDTAICNELLEN